MAGVCEETSLTLPNRKRLIIPLTNDLAGNGPSGMNSKAAWSGFDSRMLLTLARTAGSLRSLLATFHFCRSLRKFESGSHLFHGGANQEESLDKDGPSISSKDLPRSLVSKSDPSNLLEASIVPTVLDE